MRWRSETVQEWTRRCEEWHRVFAWLPHKDHKHGYRIWLEFCLRKLSASSRRRWDYRPITILADDLGLEPDVEETVDMPDPYAIIPGATTRVVQRKKLPRR